MFSITFTALSNLLQIKARICMFLCGAPAVHKEGSGGSAWLVSCPCVPVVPLPGLCPAMATVGCVRSAVPLQGGWPGGMLGWEGAPELICLPGTSTRFVSKYLPTHQTRLFHYTVLVCHKTLNLSERFQRLDPPHYIK